MNTHFPGNTSPVSPVAILFFLLPLSSFAALFQIDQLSDPAGFLSQTNAIEGGTSHPSVYPPLSSNGYAFGYWTIDNVRQSGSDGRSLTQVSSVINAASTYKAYYFQENADSDSDGIMDWFEYRMFGDLSRGPDNDPDQDGFSNRREDELGQDPLVHDEVSWGGISSRTSPTFTFADTSMILATVKSDPAGFVTETSNYLELNTSLSTADLNGQTNGYHFAYWSVNGVRQTGPTGVASSSVDLNVSSATQLVAHYILSTEDSDADGVMDWFELNQFGDLSLGPNDDPDGDGFSNRREEELGQEATIPDEVSWGGISSRTSPTFTFADTSMVLATVGSDPAGFVTETNNFLDSNATLTTANLNGETNGYHFAYWSVNGVRQASVTGVASSSVALQVTQSSSVIAHYLPSSQDSDSDGVMDWFELYQFGNLGLGPEDDPDGDGFSNKREGELGQEAMIADQVAWGGVSSRTSTTLLYYQQVNRAPDSLDLNGSIAFLNKDTHQNVGSFSTSDLDDPNGVGPYDLNLIDGNGSTDNHLFQLSGMVLQTSQVLTAEGNFSIRLRISDDENASLEKVFHIQAIHDPNKDDDNDGLTYAQEQALGTSDSNTDSDGDGFSDPVEIAYGSDPANASSVANTPPSALQASSTLSIYENLPIGTIIGEFNATDPDIPNQLSFELSCFTSTASVAGTNGAIYVSFYVNDNWTADELFFSSASSGEKKSKTFTTNGLATKLKLLSNSNSDGWGYWKIKFNDQTILEDPNGISGSPKKTIPYWVDADESAGAISQTHDLPITPLNFFLPDGQTENDNHLFSIDALGVLRSAVVFDFENNESNYSIRVRVTDEHNAFLEKAFVISLLNEIEDLDGDGIEDFYDSDDDNDGFSDAEEIAYGSDPRDAHFVANAAPSSLDLNGSSILENQPIGAFVGLLKGIDPDANASLSYFLVDGNGSIENSLFNLDANGTLSSAVIFDNETNASNYSVRIKVSDEHNASLEKAFAISLLNEIEDLDNDGIEDFYDTDDDGDGFSDAKEIAYGSDPRDEHSLANAAPSTLDLYGSGILENQTAGTLIGLVDGIDPDTNATLSYSLVDGNGSTENSLFNLDANGTLSSAVIFDYEQNASNYSIRVRVSDEHNASLENAFTISLLNEIEDLDGDGIEDFYDADDDNDGFPDLEEIAYGSDPRDANFVANAAPASLDLNGSGILENQPISTIVGLTEGIDPDSSATLSYSLVDGNGSMENSLFSLDANGTLSSAVIFDYEQNASNYSIRVQVTDEHNASLEKPFVISLLNEIEDLDGDGIEDFYDFDDDGDGFSDAREIAYGSDPRDAHSVANAAPSSLDLKGSDVLENQPIGAVVGLLQGIDPDANASLSYSLVDGNGSIDNPLFSLDENGTLSSAVILDYETNASNYSIRVQVIDEHNASMEKTFAISLLNEIEDLDGDGIEDFYDSDDDNDGFPDLEEIAYGSDPRDAGSVANATPSALDLNGSGILENQPIGTIIGLTEGIDPDAIASLSYSLVDGNGSMDNALFSLDANGTLSSTVIFDYETNASNYSIRVRVSDEHNASMEKAFVIGLLNEIEDLDADGIEDFYDSDDDGDGFFDAEEIAYGSDPRDAGSVANAAPSSLELNGSAIQENQPAGTLIGLIRGIDPDANASISYSLVDGNGSTDKPLFSLDANGTLSSAVVFDFENNESNYYIRVRVTDEHNGSMEALFAIWILDDPSDNLPNIPESNYTNPDNSYGSPDFSYSTPENKFGISGDINETSDDFYSSPEDGFLNPKVEYDTPDSNYSSPTESLGTPDYIYETPHDLYNSPDGIDESPDETEHEDVNHSSVDPFTQLLPWVRNLEEISDENGTHILSFEAGNEYGAELLGAGILLISSGTEERFPADLLSASSYVVTLDGLQAGRTYRYQAYARNQVGETLGAVHKLYSEDNSSSSPWWGETAPDGWVRGSWMGAFLPTESGWIFHSRLGWIYSQQDEVGGLWIWSKEENWLWSRADLFPFLYSNDSGNWLYLLPPSSPFMFLDYAIGSAR